MLKCAAHRIGSLVAAACLAVLSAAAPARAADDTPRRTVALTEGWQFKLGDTSTSPPTSPVDETWQRVTVPHTWNRVGYYLPDPASHINRADNINKTQGIGWYRLTFRVPMDAAGQKAWLQFDAASRTAEVWLNGVRLGEHRGGFSRFRLDATAALRPDQDNLLEVRVDNTQPTA